MFIVDTPESHAKDLFMSAGSRFKRTLDCNTITSSADRAIVVCSLFLSFWFAYFFICMFVYSFACLLLLLFWYSEDWGGVSNYKKF